MAAPFLFGDSHVRNITLLGVQGVRDLGGWCIEGIGGATAHGLINGGSESGARNKILEILDSNEGRKDVYLMFGDVDCVNHITDQDGVEKSIERYNQFVMEVFDRPDVRSVHTCAVYPRTAAFFMNGRPADEYMETIRSWNSKILDPVDTHTPLLDADGFLQSELAWTPKDVGERHLSGLGSATVWDIIRAHHSASVI